MKAMRILGLICMAIFFVTIVLGILGLTRQYAIALIFFGLAAVLLTDHKTAAR